MASSAMNTAPVDPEFAKLLREIQARKAKNPLVAKPGLEKIFGTSKGDEIEREAARLGEAWRNSEGMDNQPFSLE
jgi:hypothetical protein